MKIRTVVLLVCMTLAAGAAWAHGGEEHVLGTVSAVSAASITVKTTAGKLVTVGVVQETTFSKAKVAMKAADLKVGDRVVIHAKESQEGTLVADTVEFTTPAGSHAVKATPANSN
jgi:hypothetical protein